MTPADDGRIAVVIPAYNAAATLDRTLRSVRAQTHRALQIVVVDDGSTDATAAIAQAHADGDPRVALLRQANGGVARARNAGFAATDAAFVAMIDADDLWTPHAAERLRAALIAGGDTAGLAYCGYAVIDERDRVSDIVLPEIEGDVGDAIVRRNFIGNGSAALFRRAALVSSGGYDPALRDAGAQGCEDHLLYFRIARDWRFVAVRAPLLGYRTGRGAMSQNLPKMLRSHDLCLRAMVRERPECGAAADAARPAFARWLFARSVVNRSYRAMPALYRAARAGGRRRIARDTIAALLRAARRRLRANTASFP